MLPLDLTHLLPGWQSVSKEHASTSFADNRSITNTKRFIMAPHLAEHLRAYRRVPQPMSDGERACQKYFFLLHHRRDVVLGATRIRTDQHACRPTAERFGS